MAAILIRSLLSRLRSPALEGGMSLVRRVHQRQEPLRAMTDAGLQRTSLGLRYEILSGTSPGKLLADGFALVREAARRALGMEHFDVQLLGGLAMHRRGIAVMQTGEGKTLTATLPLYMAALEGRGAHLATANDYLAQRDAGQMRPLFELLGMTVGTVTSETRRTERRAAWHCDVTYTTAREIGFDFLRDRLLLRQLETGRTDLAPDDEDPARAADRQPMLRELNMVLLDEADSILIDEARTPLIVSGDEGPASEERAALFRWADATAQTLGDSDVEVDAPRRRVTLTAAGRRAVRVSPQPPEVAAVPLAVLYEQVELAAAVHRFYIRDRHYVVRDQEVVIVDEFTGRLAEGRRWRSGIHQAVEVREGLPMSAETGDSARTTLQDLFLRYRHMAGMTGTVGGSAAELEQIYRLRVCEIPTNRPPRRRQLPDRILRTADEKWAAVAEQVAAIHKSRQPVLVGTRSIDKSELLSRLLDSRGIPHQVLNARNHEHEASMVAAAGRAGMVTVATNMAGRGTDIQPDAEALRLGGLHVICTELHDASRIDRQLIGRCGRQGDPGSWQVFVSLEDEILRNGLGQSRHDRLLQRARSMRGLDHLMPVFRQAQRAIETRHFQARKLLMFEEQQRHQQHLELGMDPWLDAPQM